MEDTYQGLLGLDKSPKALTKLNLVVSFITVIWIAFLNYLRIANTLPQMPLRTFLEWLAWISPTCIAIAWLRITGVKWKQTILFFIAVPIAFKVIMFILGFLLAIVMGD